MELVRETAIQRYNEWFPGFAIQPMPGVAAPTNDFPGPCAVNCSNGEDLYGFHPGGCNILMTDGAVRFLDQKATLNLVAMLLTPNDDYPMPDF